MEEVIESLAKLWLDMTRTNKKYIMKYINLKSRGLQGRKNAKY